MLVLPEAITHVQAPACLNMLREAARAEQGSTLLVDAGALARFDSSALAVLLACRREALRQQRGFAVVALPAHLRSLAALYGVSHLLPDAAAPQPEESAPAAASTDASSQT